MVSTLEPSHEVMKNCFQNLAFRWCERRYGVAPGAAPDDACKAIVLKNLDEIYAGVCDGMMYEEVAQTYPEEVSG